MWEGQKGEEERKNEEEGGGGEEDRYRKRWAISAWSIKTNDNIDNKNDLEFTRNNLESLLLELFFIAIQFFFFSGVFLHSQITWLDTMKHNNPHVVSHNIYPYLHTTN